MWAKPTKTHEHFARVWGMWAKHCDIRAACKIVEYGDMKVNCFRFVMRISSLVQEF